MRQKDFEFTIHPCEETIAANKEDRTTSRLWEQYDSEAMTDWRRRRRWLSYETPISHLSTKKIGDTKFSNPFLDLCHKNI